MTVGRVVATDLDPGPAGDVRYYIVAGNDGLYYKYYFVMGGPRGGGWGADNRLQSQG